jgi:hypothetical protein
LVAPLRRFGTEDVSFLGVSFADPNIQYILGRVKQLLDKNGRQHYCLLKAPISDDTPEGDYQLKRFTHWLADLRRYNIQPVLLDDYKQVGASSKS